MESFRKDAVSISSVVLQKFHSGFLTRGGQVLTCGHGRGGRLGHGSETMQLVPKGDIKVHSEPVSQQDTPCCRSVAAWPLRVLGAGC